MEEDAPPGVPEWVVTYGDMMSLLLTFFIMLVSMSQLKQDGRTRATLNAIEERFGPDDVFESGTPGTAPPTPTINSQLSSDSARSDGSDQRGSRDADGVQGANNPVEQIRDGSQVTLGGPTVFGRYSADMSPELETILDRLATVVASSQRIIAVRGHASPEPLPPGAQFQDHYALAFARAESVGQYLVDRGIDTSRIVTSTAGASEPKIRTRDPEKQRSNDRVDVFLVDAYSTGP